MRFCTGASMTHGSCFEPAQSPTGAPPGPTVPMACQDHIPHPRAPPGRFRGDAPAFLLQTLNRRWAVGAERASGSLQRQSDGTRLEGGLGSSARWVFSWVGGLIGLPVWKLSHAPGARERSDIFLLVFPGKLFGDFCKSCFGLLDQKSTTVF